MPQSDNSAVTIQRGLQLQKVYTFSQHVKTVARAVDRVVAHYSTGSTHTVALCSVKDRRAVKKFSVPVGLSQLLFIKSLMVHVAICRDYRLRVFNQYFEELQVIPIDATIYSLIYKEDTREVFAGGVGFLRCWNIKDNMNEPLVAGHHIQCMINEYQWIVSLHVSEVSQLLCAVCQDGVYIIDTKTYKQNTFISNGEHNPSITCGLLYEPLHYLITAAKNGVIKVWSYILETELYALHGHLKLVTGLVLCPQYPHFISASLDGTIRMWNLLTFKQTYRLDLGDTIQSIALSNCGRELLCHSSIGQWVKIFSFTQVESVFTVVNSKIPLLQLVHMQRQPSSQSNHLPPPRRVLAVADDGGVRLISARTGKTLTILFPMFTGPLLLDVVYNPTEDLLYTLLSTHELLVFTAQTNPCSVKELWTPITSEEGVTCIAMCQIGVEGTTVVFGGQIDGYITLILGYRYHMTKACPAHNSHVISLTTSTDATQLMVSYGGDCVLNVWKLIVQENRDIVLMSIATITPYCTPVGMALMENRLCLAMDTYHQILVYDLDEEHLPSDYSPERSELTPIVHQHEDDHEDDVLAVAASPCLPLFVSSGRDGKVKVWDKDNQLVADIHFGSELESVCFAGNRGDLLVGFQQQICLVKAELFLPIHYQYMEGIYSGEYYVGGRDFTNAIEQAEKPLPFDPNLEFWYDPARVPTQPILQHHRRLSLALEEAQAKKLNAQDYSEFYTNTTRLPPTTGLPPEYQHLPSYADRHTAGIASDPVGNNHAQQPVYHHNVVADSIATEVQASQLQPTSDYTAGPTDSRLQGASTPPLVIPTFAPSKRKKVAASVPTEEITKKLNESVVNDTQIREGHANQIHPTSQTPSSTQSSHISRTADSAQRPRATEQAKILFEVSSEERPKPKPKPKPQASSQGKQQKSETSFTKHPKPEIKPSLSKVNVTDAKIARRHSKEYGEQLVKNQVLLESVQALLDKPTVTTDKEEEESILNKLTVVDGPSPYTLNSKMRGRHAFVQDTDSDPSLMLDDLKKEKVIVAGPNTFGGTFAIQAGEQEAAAAAAAAAEAESVAQSDSKQSLNPDDDLVPELTGSDPSLQQDQVDIQDQEQQQQSSGMTDAELLMLLEKARANIEEMLKGGGQGLTDTMEGILTSETEPEDDVSHDPDTTTLDPALPTSLSSGGSIHISTSATSLDHKPSSAIERQTSSPFPITSAKKNRVRGSVDSKSTKSKRRRLLKNTKRVDLVTILQPSQKPAVQKQFNIEIPFGQASSSQKPAQKKRSKQAKQQQKQQQHEPKDQEKLKRTGKANQASNPLSRPPKAFPFFHQETGDNAYAGDSSDTAAISGDQQDSDAAAGSKRGPVSAHKKNRGFQLHSESLSDTLNTLSSLLTSTENRTLKTSIEAIKNLKSNQYLPEGTVKGLADSLVELLYNTTSSLLQESIISTLGHIGISRKKILLALLPHLTDENLSVRHAAFFALKQLTGVTNRSQLQQLMIKMRLLKHVQIDENEVLSEVAARIRNNIARNPSNRTLSTSTLADFNDDWVPVNEQKQSNEDVERGETQKQGNERRDKNKKKKHGGRQSDEDQSQDDQEGKQSEEKSDEHQKLKHEKRGMQQLSDQKRADLDDFDYTLLLSPSRQHVLQERRRTLHTIPETSGVYDSRSLPELSKLQGPNATLLKPRSLTHALPMSHSLPELSALPRLRQLSELNTGASSNQPKLSQHPAELTSEMKSSLTTAIHSRWNPCLTEQQFLYNERTYGVMNKKPTDKASKHWQSSTVSGNQRLGRSHTILPSPLHCSFRMTSTKRGHLFSSISALERKVQNQLYSNMKATSQSTMYQILSSSCAFNQLQETKPGWNQFAWSEIYPLLQRTSHGNRTRLNVTMNTSRVPHLRLPPIHLLSSVHFSKYAVMQTFLS